MESFHAAEVTFQFHQTHRPSVRCHHCQAQPGRVGDRRDTQGPDRWQDSALPAWLLTSLVSLKNLLTAIFRKCRESHMIEVWSVFLHAQHYHFPRLPWTIDVNGLWADRSKNWEVQILWASCWLCPTALSLLTPWPCCLTATITLSLPSDRHVEITVFNYSRLFRCGLVAKSSACRAESMCKGLRGLGNPPVIPRGLCKKRFTSIAGHTTVFLSTLQNLN